MIERHCICADSEHRSCRNQRRDQHRRHARTKAREIEPELPGGIVWRHRAQWRRDVVVTPTMFVISNDQKCLLPARAVAQTIIHIMNQLFTEGHVVIWMLTI